MIIAAASVAVELGVLDERERPKQRAWPTMALADALLAAMPLERSWRVRIMAGRKVDLNRSREAKQRRIGSCFCSFEIVLFGGSSDGLSIFVVVFMFHSYMGQVGERLRNSDFFWQSSNKVRKIR